MEKKNSNKIIGGNRLFWFLKDGAKINLQDKSQLDLYIQQILSCGKAEDIRQLLETINPSSFRESFNRIKRFLKKEVRTFWRDYLESSV